MYHRGVGAHCVQKRCENGDRSPKAESLVDSFLQQETEQLRWSWDKFPREHLDSYLLSDVENPRINSQSILTRALIADTLFPGELDSIIDAEWRFGSCMTWLVRSLGKKHSHRDLLDCLEKKDLSICPEFVLETYEDLQDSECLIPDYLTEALVNLPCDDDSLICESALNTFELVWLQTLAAREDIMISIVEPACGSANDYRFLSAYGFAPFLDYSGFDLSRKNIQNARKRFPEADFFVGNVFQIPMDDGARDYLFVHDLFEHLSPLALEEALDEVLRVAKNEAWLSFFHLDTIPEHRFQVVNEYHWNTLSLDRIVESLMRRAHNVEVVDISGLIRMKFGFADYYNAQAKTLIVEI